MAKSLQLKYAIWAYLFMAWSTMAYAADNRFVDGLESIPHKAFAYVIGLAILGGAAGTLNKLSRPDTSVRNLPLEIIKDTFASVVAGLLAFFAAGWVDKFDFWLTAIVITLAGYGGSKVLDAALVDGVMPWVKDLARRVFNIPPPKDGTSP